MYFYSYRGFATRKRLSKATDDVEHALDIDLDDPVVEEAALTIQTM